MDTKSAKANVPGFRQETQFSCMAASLAACLKAHGKDQTEADVNRVMGAGAMRGATWEDLTAAAQYFGMRSTLVVPSTVNQLREWTDRGIPVVIAYNPEGRPWSHASVVFDVTGEGADTMIHIMDPNIPDPDETVRVMPKADFYKVWGEPIGDKMIVRRPACAVEREITSDGRQVMASHKVAEEYDCYKDYKGGSLSYEEYQECLRRFREDSGGYGGYGGYGGGRSRYQSRPRRPSDPKAAEKAKVLDGLLNRRHNDFLASIRAQLLAGKGLSPKQEAAVRKWLRDPKDIELFGGPPAPAAGSAVGQSDQDARLSILDTLLSRRPGDRFIQSIRDQVARGRSLSEKQLKAIRRNLYQNRMRDEADMFRAASSHRVAAQYVGRTP